MAISFGEIFEDDDTCHYHDGNALVTTRFYQLIQSPRLDWREAVDGVALTWQGGDRRYYSPCKVSTLAGEYLGCVGII